MKCLLVSLVLLTTVSCSTKSNWNTTIRKIENHEERARIYNRGIKPNVGELIIVPVYFKQF